MVDFKKYFKFPLELDDFGDNPSMVRTSDYGRAFDFSNGLIVNGKDKSIALNKATKIKIVSKLNGDNVAEIKDIKFSYRDGFVYLMEDEEELGTILVIRSWGRLTGIGGFNLKEKKASEIQDEFGKFIINTLNN